ncbi:uncharacterized protein LOC105214653 [Zeugodacus cucurbitae]|uniref:uncharacterized protein LOC105214653 n=1 Tax=Zeugodacus cucurbitae TaxID=28588 RepID=UPI0005967983|nr:uncharacterized protein LOC105214653 [Zeugodacus cucurbitae]
MNPKSVLSIALLVLVLGCFVQARHVPRHQNRYVQVNGDEDDDFSSAEESAVAGRLPHPNTQRALSHKQARVFPGALAIKKLVLLKFKKIVPISLILLRASDENEAELVPVYPTSEIPADVQFIPTPNGVSGHRDVQAIAIPKELHQQLELNGLANLESIESLLNQAQEGDAETEADAEAEDLPVAVVNEQPNNPEDEPLNVAEDDVDQLLENLSVDKTKIATANVQSVRRLAADDLGRPSLVRASQLQTGVEEIPLFLYAAKDTPQIVRPVRKGVRHSVKQSARRYHN